LPPAWRRASASGVTQPIPNPGPTTAAEAAWAKVRAMGDIQYTPLAPAPAPASQPPGWLRAVSEWLAKWLSPLGKWLNAHWHLIEIGTLVLACLAVFAIIGLAWTTRQRKARALLASDAPMWRPDSVKAEALLADADQLAQAGRYDDAVHLLLRRSFEDIAVARPDWLTPASTAREITRLNALPLAARAAFGVIAGEVERSRYALAPLGPPDWTRARAAYAAFAVPNGGAPQ